jgi:hypothetical protein
LLRGLKHDLSPPPPPQFKHWGRGFESHTRHECLCAQFRCVVLYVGSAALRWADHPSKSPIDCLCDLKLKTRPRPNERTVSNYSFLYKLLVSSFQDTISHII